MNEQIKGYAGNQQSIRHQGDYDQGYAAQGTLVGAAITKGNEGAVQAAIERLQQTIEGCHHRLGELVQRLGQGGVLSAANDNKAGPNVRERRPVTCPMDDRIQGLTLQVEQISDTLDAAARNLCV
jgi:hypothetical protein